MKYLSFLLLLLVVVSPGCDHCRYVDCVPTGIQFYFRMIDDAGKDLFFDEKVPISEITLTTGNGTQINYFQQTSSSPSMHAILPGETTSLEFKYKDRSAVVDMATIQLTKGECCGPTYGITEATSSTSITASRDPAGNDVFTIRI